MAVELIIESTRALGEGPGDSDELKVIPLTFIGVAILLKGTMLVYCFSQRYPSARIFMARFPSHPNTFLSISFFSSHAFHSHIAPD